jgi:N-acetyl-1-D-myo-inositol-2-amino-2-deoxy-alpha-D-glucopyranoside deacetylase
MTQQSTYQPTFMAVHAHPDDEVMSTGGTFALLAARGVRTVLVTSNLGEEGEIVDPDLSEEQKKELFPHLAETRVKELAASVKALNISEHRLLGYRDSGMAGTPSNNHPDAFYRAVFDEAVKRLVSIIRELQPQVIVTYDPFGSYGHPDHVQAHRITLVAFEAAGDARCYRDLPFPAWQPTRLYYAVVPRSAMTRMMEEGKASGEPGPWDNPAMNTELMGIADELISTRIDVRPYIENKLQALRAHKTQIHPAMFERAATPEQLEQFLGYEHYVLAHQALMPHPGEMETNLFPGLV